MPDDVNAATTPPAEGERNAMRGFHPQYVLFARLILDALRVDDLDGIRVADPNAGRVDDIQVLRVGRIDAYQVKWEKYGVGNLTFTDFIEGTAADPSLFKQLVDGLKDIRAAHPTRTCNVHLFTCKQPSKHDSALGAERPKGFSQAEGSFAAFKTHVWDAIRQHGQSEVVPSAWRPAWQRLCQAAGLTSDEGVAILKQLHLETGQQLPKLYTEWEGMQAAAVTDVELDDLRELYGLLQEFVTGERAVVEVDRLTLLRRLGWERRFNARHKHEFPQPSVYASNQVTETAVERWIAEHTSGYLAVVGSPGSGKSTLGSRALMPSAERRLRVVRYLAYVPDGPSNSSRGESVDFLNDVTLQLGRLGAVAHVVGARDLSGLRARLAEGLRGCGDEFRRSGARTVIHVDGLDHVPREYRPSRSFLADLPLPGDLPEGVIVVLGTQRVDLVDLPFEVQRAISDTTHQVRMAPLADTAVEEVLDRLALSAPLSTTQRRQAVAASAGHPLSLSYLMRELQSARTPSDLDAAIAAAAGYGGEVERRYEAVWQRELQSSVDHGALDALGLACRLRRGFRLAWLARISNEQAVVRVRNDFAYLFDQDPDDTWHFFHNSFRLFVRAKTAAFGIAGPDVSDRRYHDRIAKACAATPESERERWELSYHAEAAGDITNVVQEIVPATLAGQLMAFRPVRDIFRDCRLLFDVAIDRQDPTLLCRSVLLGAEYADRAENLDQAEWLENLIDIGEIAPLIWHLREGRELQVGATFALKIAARLFDVGRQDEARRLFDLASREALAPDRSRFAHIRPAVPYDEWSAAAARLLSMREISSYLERIDVPTAEDSGETDESASAAARGLMRQWLALHLGEVDRWPDCLSLVDAAMKEDGTSSWFHPRLVIWDQMFDASRHGAVTLTSAMMDAFSSDLLAEARPAELDPGDAAQLARIVRYQRGAGAHAEVRAILESVRGKSLEEVARAIDGHQRHVMEAEIGFAAAWAQSIAPTITPQLIRSNVKSTLTGQPLFIAACRDLGTLAGMGRAGIIVSPPQLEARITPLLRLFNREFRETRQWRGWLELERLKGRFMSNIVRAVARHGGAALKQLAGLFEREWDRPTLGRWWGNDVTRKVLLTFVDHGYDSTWASGRLSKLEVNFAEGADATGRVGEWSLQAENFAHLYGVSGDQASRSECRRALGRMFNVSFGVGYRKDDQMDEWIEWLGIINRIEAAEAANRIGYFATCLCSLEETTEGRTAASAAKLLIKTSFDHHPDAAVELLHYFHGNEVGWFAGLLESFLNRCAERAPSSRLVFDAVTDLFFSVSPSDEAGLLDTVFRPSTGEAQLDTVVLRVLTLAHPEARSGWIEHLRSRGVTIAGEAEPESEPDAPPPTERSRTDPESIIDGGARDAFLREVCDVDPAKASTAWEKGPAELRTESGAVQLAQSIPEDRKSARALVAISTRLVHLGALADARLIAERAVRCCHIAEDYPSWTTDHAAAFEALHAAGVTTARTQAWKSYGTASRSNEYWPSGMPWRLRSILPVLCGTVPWQQLWPEIERHVRALFAEAPLPKTSPSLPSDPATEEPEIAVAALARLLIAFLSHATHAVARSARRILADAVVRGDVGVIPVLNEVLSSPDSSDDTLLGVLQALDAARHARDGCVATYTEALLHLFNAPNFQVRHLAMRLCPRPSNADIPSRSPHPDAGRLAVATSGLSLPDDAEFARQAKQNLLLFTPELTALSDIARLDVNTVTVAAAAVMNALPSAPEWTPEAEKVLQHRLQFHGPKLPYAKQRARVARLATGRVAAALEDAGHLGHHVDAIYNTFFRHHDPLLLTARPIVKPQGIALGQRPDYKTIERWHDSAGDAVGMLSSRLDGRWIIAEHTTIDHLRDEGAQEIRTQCVWATSRADAFREAVAIGGADQLRLFGRLFGWPSDDSADEFVDEFGSHNVRLAACAEQNRWRDTVGSGLLVPAPSITAALRWSRLANTLDYVDAAGERVASSLWWQRGETGIGSSVHDAQAASGYLLLATDRGEASIRQTFPQLTRIRRVVRTPDAFKEPSSITTTIDDD